MPTRRGLSDSAKRISNWITASQGLDLFSRVQQPFRVLTSAARRCQEKARQALEILREQWAIRRLQPWNVEQLEPRLLLSQAVFNAVVSYPGGEGQLAGSVVLADFNQDGRKDLLAYAGPAAGYGFGNSTYAVLLNQGAGTFGTAVNYALDLNTLAMAAADLNNDGRIDLVGANSSNGMEVHWGNGDGTFQSPVYFGGSSYPNLVTTGDFNNDGLSDAVLGSGYGVTTFLSNGDGTFLVQQTGLPSYSLDAADFNNDGYLDLVSSNYDPNTYLVATQILLNNGDGSFQLAGSSNIGDMPAPLAAGDFNGDGNADVAFVSMGSYMDPSLPMGLVFSSPKL